MPFFGLEKWFRATWWVRINEFSLKFFNICIVACFCYLIFLKKCHIFIFYFYSTFIFTYHYYFLSKDTSMKMIKVLPSTIFDGIHFGQEVMIYLGKVFCTYPYSCFKSLLTVFWNLKIWKLALICFYVFVSSFLLYSFI